MPAPYGLLMLIFPACISRCLTRSRNSLAALLVKVVPITPSGLAFPSCKDFSNSAVSWYVFAASGARTYESYINAHAPSPHPVKIANSLKLL